VSNSSTTTTDVTESERTFVACHSLDFTIYLYHRVTSEQRSPYIIAIMWRRAFTESRVTSVIRNKHEVAYNPRTLKPRPGISRERFVKIRRFFDDIYIYACIRYTMAQLVARRLTYIFLLYSGQIAFSPLERSKLSVLTTFNT